MKKIIMFLPLLVLGMVLISASASATEDRMEILGLSCTACHGTDGMSPGVMPVIGDKDAKYIEDMLARFRNGTEKSTIMNRIAKGYSMGEIKMIAKYYGELNAKRKGE